MKCTTKHIVPQPSLVFVYQNLSTFNTKLVLQLVAFTKSPLILSNHKAYNVLSNMHYKIKSIMLRTNDKISSLKNQATNHTRQVYKHKTSK